MSDHWPETRDELIERFCAPDHNGRIAIEDRELFTRFVDKALSMPDQRYTYAFSDDPSKQPPVTPSALCNAIYDGGYFLNDSTGWIDRDGKFYGCAYARHERLLEWMDMNSIEQEQEGWIKLSRYTAHATFAPNDAQCATLMRINDEVQEKHAFSLNFAHLHNLPQLPRKRRA
ncbi:hypothetical protein CcrColossus_gp323 [Caulobacter phage CcrColossus]|uniref:Uncharacterized protein n=1 Tax=Caulobacter phage CcrColossus TaxID=1211640 RepID=K4JWB4_9CAUD|nr:hypothetical protein CcrColossus_gp323 [Caulobacter phage CcrColossus]AFU88193.1 hypothetical protein CcrColossus_gp323 [Caulobacter phage CcrColossus]